MITSRNVIKKAVRRYKTLNDVTCTK